MLSNFPAEQTVLPGCVPTATVFLSYLTNKARRRKSPGCPRAVCYGIAGRLLGRRGQQSHASGEYLGQWAGAAVHWVGQGRQRLCPAGPRGHYAPGQGPLRRDARSPRGPNRSRVFAQVGRRLCCKSGKGESPKPPGKGWEQEAQVPAGRETRLQGHPGAAHSPPTPAPPRRRPGMNEAPPPAAGAYSQAT